MRRSCRPSVSCRIKFRLETPGVGEEDRSLWYLFSFDRCSFTVLKNKSTTQCAIAMLARYVQGASDIVCFAGS